MFTHFFNTFLVAIMEYLHCILPNILAPVVLYALVLLLKLLFSYFFYSVSLNTWFLITVANVKASSSVSLINLDSNRSSIIISKTSIPPNLLLPGPSNLYLNSKREGMFH